MDTGRSEIRAARTLARIAHDGQTRWDGETPYITHPVRVAERLASLMPAERHMIAAAYLHDVVEDTTVTLSDLGALGFERRTIELVDLVTQRTGETYFAYIRRVAQDAWARQIKLADIADNSVGLDPEHGLVRRYAKARAILRAEG